MANHAKGVECPALAEMVRALQAVLPELRGAGIGTIRYDGSRHTAGLAADIMLDSKDAKQKAMADEIIAALVDMQGQIRWHDIIYTDWIDTPTGPPQASHFHIPSGAGGYGGTPLQKNPVERSLGQQHENHIHVDWVDFSMRISNDKEYVYDWPPDAKVTGFGSALTGRVMTQRTGWNPLPKLQNTGSSPVVARKTGAG
jgi:hypothetical protein